jgi:recombination protein RecA
MAGKRKARDVGKAAAKAPKPSVAKARVTIPKPADYLKQLRAMSGVDDKDYAFFSDPLAWTSSVVEWIPTGSLAIDRQTGGGYPVGRIIEVASWEGVGKSTLLDQSIADHQRRGGICVLIDSEQARDEAYTMRLGVNPDELIMHKALTVEEAFIGIDRVLAIQEAHVKKLAAKKKQPPPMLIVWDSLGGTPTKAELKGAADDSHVADAAKKVKMNMRRMAQRIANARACLVFSNHLYENIGGFGGLKSYGGSGIRYFTSLRLWLTRTEQLKQGDRVIGHAVKSRIKKTRVCKPRPPTELGLIYGAGFHNAYTLFEWGKTHGVSEEHKWITQRGAWSYLMLPDDTHKAFQGTFMGFGDMLVENPAVYEKMAEQYMAEAA